ncbi:MAG TPA: amylo-alpha-1,6-glucosidase [Bacteroidales bacterium]|nr:amylo-alpha-1,6-glucosidase [Bacteroidales bacterium]HPT02187.1 amylo-alpha-1,6-glucosidase [Bacteroidales bacterium]
MSYIQFTKDQLVNLEFSLTRELLRSNRAGSYACSTIIGCNTRKYHGLLVAPQPQIDGGMHVLLSSLDETVIQQNAEFNLALHRYMGNVYSPKGHKYITDFVSDPLPTVTYRVGGVILTKEMIFIAGDDRCIIKYTLVDAHSPTTMRFRPFLAFRNIHAVSKANGYADKDYHEALNGIYVRLYPGFSNLYMQFSKKPVYTHHPDWYFNFEYIREKARGYDYLEDLLSPGTFELPIDKGESIYFAVSLEEANPESIIRIYEDEVSEHVHRDSFEHCLLNSARQFILHRGKHTEILAGFPWFGRMSRDTFIALPGLTLLQKDYRTFKAVIDSLVAEMKGPLFPHMGSGISAVYNSVDAPLWFFWTLQQYMLLSGDKNVWKYYQLPMKTILYGFRQGALFNIHMLDSGLLYAGQEGTAVTWMDAIVEGQPVTPRIGLPVEINALWYNAIMFALELARKNGDSQFVKDWEEIAEKIPDEFVRTFWIADKNYLADYVYGDYRDKAVRPNQLFAASLPYSPLQEEQCKSVIDRVTSELLTPRGIRTLSPINPAYKPEYTGNQAERDRAYHQGSVFPWLLGHYAEGYLKLYEESGVGFIQKIYAGLEEVMTEHGIGSVSELYDGDPPHKPSGAISQAWSVAEVTRMKWLLDQYKQEKKSKK